MESAEVAYTTPRLFKGKTIDLVPKGSTKAKEEAKQSWYVDFFFYNPGLGEMERFRFNKNLNRIKVPKEKLNLFTELLDTYKNALDGGWSPINKKSNEKLKREVVSLTLDKGKELFEAYHKAKGTRQKSIQIAKNHLKLVQSLPV
jgi:hypothetical protein